MREALLALPFGVAIGLLLGLVGGGGAILAVPVLVYVLDQDVKDATTTSLLVVGATALAGALAHSPGGGIRVRLALLLAAGGAAGAVAGTALNRVADPDAILFLFAFVLLAAAYGMVRRSGPQPRPEAAGGTARALLAGAAVGVLTGFFGVGGGFLTVPLLVVLFGLPLRAAVATSLLVIALSSAAGLVAHLASGGIDWAVAGAFALGGIAGAPAGSLLSPRVPARRLSAAFAILLVAVAAFLLVEAAAGAAGA